MKFYDSLEFHAGTLTHTVVVSANSTWTFTDVTRTVDPLAGDGLGFAGILTLYHGLDLDQSPGTAYSGDAVLVYNSDRVDVKPLITAVLQTANDVAFPDTLTAELFWNGESQGSNQYSLEDYSPGEVIAVGEQVGTAETDTGRHLWQLDVTFDYAEPITYSAFDEASVPKNGK